MDGGWTLSVADPTNPVACLDNAALYCFESSRATRRRSPK
jgi:hypothetical protein